jgi:hypothetical protein
MFTKLEHLRKRKNINNMTPKEKARELVNKFYVILMKKNYPNVAQMDAARECALLTVEEILDDDMYDMSEDFFDKRISYHQEVKQEIKKTMTFPNIKKK